MKAVFYDSDAGLWAEFLEPVVVRAIDDPGDIPAVLGDMTRRAETEALHAVFFLSYEASPAFDPALTVRTPGAGSFPLAWIGLFARKAVSKDLTAFAARDTGRGFSVGPFATSIAKTDYREAFDRVKERLREGDSYQVNLTFSLRAPFAGSAFEWFSSIASESHGRYPAFIETDGWAVCSFSPELFFEKKGEIVTLRPMKGTLPARGDNPDSVRERLRASGKDRAENLMIVDMIRNDIGRVAETGTVGVPSLFETEAYKTVIQMTSTVRARVIKGFPELIAALFPCASITGAPKKRSMEIIAALESEERGLYTGTIGRMTPSLDCVCSVAIRTAVID